MNTIVRIVCLLSLACSLVSCYDDFVEGYVYTNQVDTTQVSETTAICSGKIEMQKGENVSTEITETGFLYSENELEFTNSIQSTQGSGTNSFSCQLTNLSPDTVYYIRAYAVITCKYSGGTYSNKIYGDIKSFSTKRTQEEKIVVPTNFSAEQIGSYVVLNWNAPAVDGLIGYIIERSDNGGSSYTALDTIYYYTTFTDKNPIEGTNYYRIKASFGSPLKESDYIYKSCDFTSGNGQTPSIASPTNVSAIIDGDGIKITWDKVTGATDYRIYRCNTAGGDYGDPIGRTGDTDTWTDPDPLNGDNYYKVTAYNMYESNLSDYAYCNFP